VLAALGREADAGWVAPLPPAVTAARMAAIRENARWVRVHLAPWVARRVTGRSSGDGVTAKRPELVEFAGRR
jgi:hypothetical protein